MSKLDLSARDWGIVAAGVALPDLIFGSAGKNNSFQPQNEFKLDPWINLKLGGIDLSINKAVLYLLLASGLTIGTMTCLVVSPGWKVTLPLVAT